MSGTPNALLCTVGTSMFVAQPPLRELTADRAAACLAALPDPAQGGAEHQTMLRLLERPELLDPRELHLFASDSNEGEHAARILARRFREAFTREPGVVRCKDLCDRDPQVFASRGLRSLVNRLTETIVRLRRDGLRPVIDATGGYKPQIAYAALIGQVLDVPVYYRYANFDDVIVLAPLPISMEVQVWFDHLWFFDRLCTDVLRADEVPKHDPRITSLLHREDRLVMLSPLGELMHAAADRLIASESEALLPPPAPSTARRKIAYEDDNSGKHPGLDQFCNRLLDIGYVTRVGTFYYNRDCSEMSRVRIPASGEPDRLEVWYGDGSALTKLNVWTTASKPQEVAAARADIARRLDIGDG